jgi:sulfide:quinone oxidoreductase
VVHGAGFEGLDLMSILTDAFGDVMIDIVLINKEEAFVFGFSKLDVMFGRQMPVAGLLPRMRLERSRSAADASRV